MRLLLFIIWFGLGAIFTSCLYRKSDSIITEQQLSQKKALEDFDYYVRILKKAHPAIYAFCTEQRFRQLQDSLRSHIGSSISLREFYGLLNRINNAIACVHTNLYIPDKAREAIDTIPVFFPYPTCLVEGRLLVNVSGTDLPEGSEITMINDIRVADLLDSLKIFQTADGSQNPARLSLAAQDLSYSYFLRYGPVRSFRIRYREPGKDTSLYFKTLAAVAYKDFTESYKNRYYYDPTDIDYDFYINREARYAYMTIRTFEFDTYSRDKAFEHFCENSFNLLRHNPGIRNLIIDIRENDGGNYSNCHLLYSWLATHTFSKYERVSSRVKRLPETGLLSPTYSDDIDERVESLMKEEFVKSGNGHYILSDSSNSPVMPMPDRFRGNVFVITNPEVSSAAAYFASLVKNDHRGMLVGEETRGGSLTHNGFINVVYELPNSKISFAFSVANVRHTYGQKEDLGRGVIPTINKPVTRDDFIKNSDTQAAYIIDSLLN